MEGLTARKSDIMLSTPDGMPYSFTIIIEGAWPVNNTVRTFEIKGKDTGTGTLITRKYKLENKDHQSYLDLFEALAHDFGLRLPQNKKPQLKPSFEATFNEVITTNITPGILYGYGDPAVLKVPNAKTSGNDRYYMLATSNDAPDAFPLLVSYNLKDWAFVNFLFPQGTTPAWAAAGEHISDYWAPEMHYVGGLYQVFFVARDKETHELCIGRAAATHPEGPYKADDAPLLKGNVIDPHIYLTDDGEAYLFWKKDNNEVWPGRLSEFLRNHPHFINALFTDKEDVVTACFMQTLWPWTNLLEPMERFLVQQVFIESVIARYTAFYNQLQDIAKDQSPEVKQEINALLDVMKTPVYAQPLTQDGRALTGKNTKVIENDLSWEAHLVEGIWVTKQNNRYYLFYAGNDFSTDQYGIGVAIAPSPLGPYKKMEEPFLRSTEKWWAPGHPSLTEGPDGKQHLFFHAYFPHQAGYKKFRALLSTPVVFKEAVVLLG